MITYKSCQDVPIEDIYAAFSAGFSDYPIPMRFSQPVFASIFFGLEGNDPGLSYIAYDGGSPVGVILCGIRPYEGMKTMRCGALCIAPGYRARGLGRELFSLHRQASEANGCARLFLEVITKNERALRLYRAAGYRQGRTLKFYTRKGPLHSPGELPPFSLRELTLGDWKELRARLPCLHLNWQNDAPCFERTSPGTLLVLGAFEGGRMAALVAAAAPGKVCFLYVEPEYRRRGIGRWMLFQAAQRLSAEKISVCLPDDEETEKFLMGNGFEKEPFEEYEMDLPL